jgi:hypothetical protein
LRQPVNITHVSAIDVNYRQFQVIQGSPNTNPSAAVIFQEGGSEMEAVFFWTNLASPTEFFN